MARDPNTALGEMRQRMHKIETAYLRAKEYLKSPEWHVKRDEVLMRLSVVLGLPMTDPTSLAINYGRAKQIILEVQEPTDIIIEFEDLRERIRRYEERAG